MRHRAGDGLMFIHGVINYTPYYDLISNPALREADRPSRCASFVRGVCKCVLGFLDGSRLLYAYMRTEH